jgi:hypothetical protein
MVHMSGLTFTWIHLGDVRPASPLPLLTNLCKQQDMQWPQPRADMKVFKKVLLASISIPLPLQPHSGDRECQS